MLYIDTNILIYLFELHEPFSKQVASLLDDYASKGMVLVTSAITVTEFLAGTVSSNLETLHMVPNLSIVSLTESLAEQAALLQRENKVNIGDAVHLATAIHQNTEAFFTNDRSLAKTAKKYMPIISL